MVRHEFSTLINLECKSNRTILHRTGLYRQPLQSELHHGLRRVLYVKTSNTVLTWHGNTTSSELTDLFFTDTNSTELVANPLTVSNATWSESKFYITKGYGPVGFYKSGVSNVSTSTIKTTGFKFYGSTAMINIDGTLETLWYAVETSVEGLWSVGWNATGAGLDDTAELLSIRKAAASNVEYPTS